MFRFIVLMVAVCMLKGYHSVRELSFLRFLLYPCCSPPFPVLDLQIFLLLFLPRLYSFRLYVRYCILFSCLSGSLAPACFGLLTNIQFSLNHYSFFENSCMNLNSPVSHCLVHCSCKIIAIFSFKLLFISFVILLSFCFTDPNSLSCLMFCNCNSACTFFLAKFYIISFSSRISFGNNFRGIRGFSLKNSEL